MKKITMFNGGTMENLVKNRRLVRFFGITLFTQAVTALVGGSIFLGPFDSTEMTSELLIRIYDSSAIAYSSILLQMITAVVIIMLGVAMYVLVRHINKTLAIVALSLYILESALLSIAQIFAYSLVAVSSMFVSNSDTSLLAIGEILLACKSFAGEIAMIPFGIGAIIFYFLLLKASVIPKWLALWGIVTAPLIMVFVPLMSFGVNVSFILLVPYVPFEFFTGLYILIKYRK